MLNFQYLRTMKKWIVVLFCFAYSWHADAQVFHFVENEYTFNKTTDNSPVHWYFEIFNDAGVDTVLRWKTHFNTIPSQWIVNFDDQTNSLNSIHDGDSADFVLQSGLSFPQKLIIGVNTANTVGNGSIEFEIYDPNAPTFRDTIIFYFNISQGTAGLLEGSVKNGYVLENQQIRLVNGESADFRVLNAVGQITVNQKNTTVFDVSNLPKNEVHFIQIFNGKKRYFFKIRQSEF